MAESAPVNSDPKPSVATWAGVSLLAILAWMWIGHRAPPAVKLLGLYACGWGLVAGLGAGLLAIQQRIRIPLWGLVWIGSIAAVGETGQVLIGWADYRQIMLAKARKTPKLDLSVIEKQAPEDLDPEARKAREQFLEAIGVAEQNKQERLQFSSYLALRLSAQNPPATPWPELFWAAEIAGAAACAVWGLHYFMQQRMPAAQPATPDQPAATPSRSETPG